MNINGMTKAQAYEVLKDQPAVEKHDHIFVRIPIAMQRVSLDGCCGSTCCNSKHTGTVAYWDTAVFHDDSFHVWCVHYPDLLGKVPQ